MEPDNLDIEIIEQLTRDGRASLRKIAEELNVSPSTVSSRLHQMEEEGVIEGFRPEVNYTELGFDLKAVIEVSVSSDAVARKEENLLNLDPVISFYEVTGDHDIVMICKFQDREEMNQLVKQVLGMDGVESTYTRVALTTQVENRQPDLERLKDRKGKEQ
ncbi:MAG: Lrp/AsnC family transcriptional regulator [Candidatus Nanohaloarchaea archaeon]|nr:Lrp/AsnC family transcriptional regulator [Candidatus Nanohaloarchaea archaeon]